MSKLRLISGKGSAKLVLAREQSLNGCDRSKKSQALKGLKQAISPMSRSCRTKDGGRRFSRTGQLPTLTTESLLALKAHTYFFLAQKLGSYFLEK